MDFNMIKAMCLRVGQELGNGSWLGWRRGKGCTGPKKSTKWLVNQNISTLILKNKFILSPLNTAGTFHFHPGMRSGFLSHHSHYLSNGLGRYLTWSLIECHFLWLAMSWTLLLSQHYTASIC